MNEIIPAILPKDYEDLKNKLALIRGRVPLVQIDLCDGIYVKNKTWPFNEITESNSHFSKILREEEGMPFWEDIDFELDLMVSDAVENFDIYTKLGPRRIIFHLNSFEDLEEFKSFLEGIDPYVRDSFEIGIAVTVSTDIKNVDLFVNLVDFVQVMGIEHIGFQGEEFTEKCLDYIKTLREKYKDLVISVDGGINLETGKKILIAGANRLVSGSAIFNQDDIIGAIEEFQNL